MSTYSQLKKIIPPDQALANKALEAALQQISAIFNSSLTELSAATQGLESNKGLNLINALTEPVPQAVQDYYAQTLATGTGTDGTLVLADVMGTPSGWVHNTALTNTITILNSMTSSGALNTLTNASTGVFTIMQNTINGTYGTGPVVIPVGKPGAGTYANRDSAFTTGLIPAANTLLNAIAAANPTYVSAANVDFAVMSEQLIMENTNLAAAGVVFANLIANVQPVQLVNNLPQYGLETDNGGAAYIMQSVSNIASLGGQAIVSTMREARNIERIQAASLTADVTINNVVAQPPADLGSGQYTAQEAINQKII